MTQNDQPNTAKPFDPVHFTREMMSLAERGQKLMAEFLAKHKEQGDKSWQSGLIAHAAEAYGQLLEQWSHDPVPLMKAGMNYWQQYMKMWQEAGQRWMGNAQAHTNPANTRRDKRFDDASWQQNAIFDFIKQSYLFTTSWVQNIIHETPGLDNKTKAKIEFYTRQWCDAMSPTNFWITNPQALRQMAESGGESLLQGMHNLLEDIERGDGELRISMTNTAAYQMGKDIAATPGKVVFRNELMELIQYSPATENVHQTPLLIIPPWINKYYILDLREQNSFVRHAVSKGHTVFMVSWVNPDEHHRYKNFENYLDEGPLAALDVIDEICGTRETNIVGYCLGGTLLATMLAYLTARGEQARVKSATYLVTMVDFAEPGDLGVFIDDLQITAIEAHMFERGYLEAGAMATTFNMLRANDLIWSFVVNNYLLGREPLPFDLLYWNADATRMPAAMHSYYLRQMYLQNRLCKPNALQMHGVPIDLTLIKTPTYMLSTRDDHIAPWRSTYAGTQIYKGEITFVLAGSGHIAGVINPPSANKYGFWTNSELPAEPEKWLEGAIEHQGSWWPHWAEWLSAHDNGATVAPRQPGHNEKYPAIEDAPGSYVKVRAL